jgi:hypothetical protein
MIRFFPRVCPFVTFEIVRPGKAFSALTTFVRTLSSVASHVNDLQQNDIFHSVSSQSTQTHHIARIIKLLATINAQMQLCGIFDTGVNSLMSFQIIESIKRFATLGTDMSFVLQQMYFDVSSQMIRPETSNNDTPANLKKQHSTC